MKPNAERCVTVLVSCVCMWEVPLTLPHSLADDSVVGALMTLPVK
jgi:hypothetical protein